MFKDQNVRLIQNQFISHEEQEEIKADKTNSKIKRKAECEV